MNLPPLSQSKVETAACEQSYVSIYIDGRSTGVSQASDRGDEVHHVMAEYVDYCAKKGVQSDWIYFNRLTVATKMDAGGILDGLRDNYKVQHKHVYGTEITMMLDEEFRPTLNISEEHWPKHVPNRNTLGLPEENDGYCAHIGTADVVLVSEDGLRGKISDYKTSPSIFDADSYQGILYSFMLLKHMPQLEQVTFELVFVRYQNCVRTVTYKRRDMPDMQETLSRARTRQMATHEAPQDAQAIPSKQCMLCPLMKDLTCPQREVNEHMLVTPEQRLMAVQFGNRMLNYHRPLLKSYAEVHGDISYRDGNDRLYVYGEMPVEKTAFPLDETTMRVLNAWTEQTGEDWSKMGLKISSTSIKGKLKAKKRAPLLEIFEESIIERSTAPKFACRTPEEGIVTDHNEYTEDF